VKILLDKGWRLDLPATCAEALALHEGLPRTVAETLQDLNAFLLERVRFLLEKRGFAADEVESVLTTDTRDVCDVADRVAAVAAVRKKEDFVPLTTAFKRVQNILAQAGESDGVVDPALVTEDAERELAADYFQARGMLDDLIGRRHWGEALAVMASLGPPLDRFFTEVMVMAEDPALRANRVALLKSMRDQFFRVARFSEIQG
jgi:glycyl-tRNA synthetase beta chain